LSLNTGKAAATVVAAARAAETAAAVRVEAEA
jgi:hypothetical protein